MRDRWILFACLLLLITSFAFADSTPPTTTFSSFQVPNTTDQNITLSCTDDDSGCKTINYNIDNNGWNHVTLSNLQDTNLVSYYKLDETSGTSIIDSKGDYNFTLSGGTVNNTGKIDKAISINETINYSNQGYLGNSSAISFWHKHISGSSGPGAMFEIPVTTNRYHQLLIDFDSATNKYYFTSYSQCGGTNYNYTITAAVNPAIYNMVSVTWDSSKYYVYINGTYDGSFTKGSAGSCNAINWRMGRYNNQYFDEISIWDKNLSNQDVTNLYNSGDGLTYPFYTYINSYSFLVSGAGDHNIQYYSTDGADNNEAVKFSYFPQFQTTKDQANSRMIFTGVTIYNDYNITSWLWSIDGTPLSGTTDQNKYYSTQANEDLNVCLTTNSLDTTCRSVKTWDTILPTIDVNVTNATYGFVSTFDINYNMTCYDNLSPINYTITWNNGTTDQTLYDSSDANATTTTGTLDLNAGQNATITFTCTDDSNNIATYTSPRVYATQFRLVNETTGVQLTPALIFSDFNILRAYTPDGNYSFDFKDTNAITTNFFSPTRTLYFEIGYKDSDYTIINRQIDFGLIQDSNIAVCVPLFQTFYQQRFVANSSREMILQNNVSNCYVIASALDYVYDTGYSITTYTIPKPYYLYIWVDGVKTFLAFINGAAATQYNLDAIAFSRTSFDIVVGQDTVGFAPLINTVTNQYDTNILQIYYKSYEQDNAQTTLTIKNGNETIWNYTEYTSADEFLVNFYWGGLGLTDQNVLELIVATTKSNGEITSKSFFFTTQGSYYPNEGANSWVVLVSVLFFLFGITLVAAGRAFGIFGIIVCIICIAITAVASGAWWVSLIQAIFLICLIYIVMMGRTTQGQIG